MPKSPDPATGHSGRRRWADRPFFAALIGLAGLYLLMIVAMLAADLWYAVESVSFSELGDLFRDDNIAYSVKLTVFSCTVTAILSVIVAVPAGYLLSRHRFPGKTLVDAVLDIPIVLPPLVVGLSLLILFNKMPPWGPSFEVMAEKAMRAVFPGMRSPGVTYNVPAVILAQFSVACAFAVRTMRNTFDQISPRTEQVALTLGCTRARAFLSVVVPEAWRGVSTAGTLAWTRAMGEFGPILVFAGSTRGRTEVMSSTVFLEFSVGALERAVVVSLTMVTIAVVVLVAVRVWDRGETVYPRH
ncbi:MAG: ABC transporter permease [Akkermansiaceae bacterium]|nr:ABC transporter permease [Akkermansiaceae bacterium]